MSLLEQLDTDIKLAMKAKETDKLRALRGLKTAIQSKQTEKGVDYTITSDDEVQAIQKSLKTRRESADVYTEQNRPDLAKIENDEISFIEAYLPKQLSIEEVEVIVKKVVADTGASSVKEMGKVMNLVKEEVAGRSDNKTISDLIKAALM